MSERLFQYADRQRAFWNVRDRETARFRRVQTIDAPDEGAWADQAQRDAEILLHGIAARSSWTILDLGCGVGRIAQKLQDQIEFRRLIAVDISDNMIAFARETVGSDPRVTFEVNNGLDLRAIANSTVDFAYSIDMFIHIFDIDIARNYVAEVHRVLTAGATFRFNVRYFDPKRAFSNTAGGIMAKLFYAAGAWSQTKQRWDSAQPAEFNGISYTTRDVRHSLLKAVDWRSRQVDVVGDRIWCTVSK